MSHHDPSSEQAEAPVGEAPAVMNQSEHARSETAEEARKPAPPREPFRRSAPPHGDTQKLKPSWILSATGEELTRDEILARYRRQRGLPEDPFEHGAPVPPPGYRDRIMHQPPAARFRSRHEEDVEEPAATQARMFTLGQTLAIGATMALVAAIGTGLTSAHYPGIFSPSSLQTPPIAVSEQTAASHVPELQLAQAAAPHDTVIDKKPVSTATLQVEDVTGETNSFIPLALHAEPSGLDKDILLKISGVPEGAYLTSGHRQDDQVWALSLADTKNVKLVVPQASNPQIDLAVAVFEPRTGELAAPVKTMTVALKDVVVEPTSAPPPGQVHAPSTAKSALPGTANMTGPVAIPAPQSVTLALNKPETAETKQLIGSADQLFRTGDVKSALRSYERAWGNDGSAAAAFGIARSHDPLVLAALAGNNGTPDRDKAIQWYQRAASGGIPAAAKAIVRLQMKP